MVPSTALAIPTYLLFAKIGLVNTPWAIILPSLVSPFGLYLMRVYAEDAVPDSTHRGGPHRRGRRVPGSSSGSRSGMLAPGFVTVLLFTLVATWNNYFLPLIMLNDPDLYPVTVGLALVAQAVGGGGASAVNAGRHGVPALGHSAHRGLPDAPALLAERAGGGGVKE